MTTKQKNYIILITICVATLLVLWYALKWHEAFKEEYSNQNYIVNYVDELRVDEFDSFVRDQRDVVIYFAKPGDKTAYDFEKSFDEAVVKYSLRGTVYYMNVGLLDNSSMVSTINQYNSTLLSGDKIESIPAMGIFRDAKLVAFITGNELTKDKVVELLSDYGFIHRFD